jgi:hypothetical protein
VAVGGIIPYFTEKNQLDYLLITPLTISSSCRVDKTAALTGLAGNRIVGANLGATFGTKQGIRLGCHAALGTLTHPKFSSTAFTKNRVSIVK